MSHVTRAVFALCAAVGMSGCVFSDPDCVTDAWNALSPVTSVTGGPSRVIYAVVLNITEEGSATDAGKALRSSSSLSLTSWRPSSTVGIGFSQTDGSDEMDSDATGLRVSDVLSDCGEGACRREFLAWIDSEAGFVALRGQVRVEDRLCASGAELRRWFTIEIEAIE